MTAATGFCSFSFERSTFLVAVSDGAEGLEAAVMGLDAIGLAFFRSASRAASLIWVDLAPRRAVVVGAAGVQVWSEGKRWAAQNCLRHFCMTIVSIEGGGHAG